VSVDTRSGTNTAAAYRQFACAFDYPQAEFWDRLEQAGSGPPIRSQEEREADYLAAFELGGTEPPVPLYEGLCRPADGREGIIEDLLRFYDFFGLRLRQDNRDYPDHLVCELEFMAFLAAREAHAAESGLDAGPYRLAQRDFLQRHLGVWLPELAQRLSRSGTVYTWLSRELADFTRAQVGQFGVGTGGDCT
jgi:DMSO reductase family type II enzyme chaperone